MDRPIGDSAQDFGSTSQYAGTVGTTPIQIPGVAGDPIATALIRCPNQSPSTRRLRYSFDGVTYHALSPGEFILWPMKGNIGQIYLQGSTAGVEYELTLNREPS